MVVCTCACRRPSAGPRPAEYRREVVAHDAAQLFLRDRRQAHRRRLVVDGPELVQQRDRVVEEAGVVRPEEDLLQRDERRLQAVQQQEQVAPGQGGDQVGQLGVEVRVLGEQEHGLVHPGNAAVGDDDPQVAELPPDVIEQRRAAQLKLGVDPGRARLMDHHRDVQLGRLPVDREGQVPVVGGPVLVHGVELQPGQAEAGHRAVKLGHRGLRALVRRVDRGEADEAPGICGHDRRQVVVAFVRVRRAGYPQHAVDVHGADQPPVQELR
jgi:hypothetical protein